ncbi:hypothetical protein HZU77_004435 [Neisseriaceae bacterium TC5R-5]|nr:hypothetical protein [Neisseriaceae bacterium TC5R-5]
MNTTTAIQPALRLMADFHRGQLPDPAEAQHFVGDLREAYLDGLHFLAEVQLRLSQPTALSSDTAQTLAYWQCLLAALGSEYGEWLQQLARQGVKP